MTALQMSEAGRWTQEPAAKRLPPDAVREISSFAQTLGDSMSLLATGSLVEGFGNDNSDIDMYVVQDDAQLPAATSIGLRTMRYVDCEHVTLASVRRLAERIDGVGWSSVLTYQQRELDRYYRIAIALPVQVTPLFSATKSLFDKRKACAALVVYATWRAFEQHSCAAVLSSAGDERSARLFARESALWAATARLAADGEGYVGPKWFGEKAARRYGAGTPEFRQLVDGYLRPGADTGSLIERQRAALAPPAPLREALTTAEFALSPTIRALGDRTDCHLIRGKAAVIRVGGLGASLCLSLGAGMGWTESIETYARQAGVPAAEVHAAARVLTGGLRERGVLVDADTKGE